jgi:hypothetical protein
MATGLTLSSSSSLSDISNQQISWYLGMTFLKVQSKLTFLSGVETMQQH